MGKTKKAFQYIRMRAYEFIIVMKEFIASGKLSRDAYRSFIDSGLLVDAHSVEKGLGLRNSRPGHSAKVVGQLLERLNRYIDRGYGTDSFAFMETLRVIDSYIDFQKQFDTSEFPELQRIEESFIMLCDRVGDAKIEFIRAELSAGSNVVDQCELRKGQEFDFGTFVSSRHSMRMYESRNVSEEDIKTAIRIANRAPSACNRQPSSVYLCNDPEKVCEIDHLITGSRGFEGETPNYIVVTTDRAYFSREEQFQWYINGGIYVSFLILALHSIGIGSCIMQWKAFYKTEKSVKRLCGIKDCEAIIAIIGCGYYADDTKCIVAQRKKPEDTLHMV